jgi:hypothetical protein
MREEEKTGGGEAAVFPSPVGFPRSAVGRSTTININRSIQSDEFF